MQKRKFNIKIGLLFWFSVFTVVAYGQININIPEANIQNRTEYQQEFPAGNYPSVLGLVPVINIRANYPSFSNSSSSTPIPLDLANIKLISIGSISLISLSTERALSQGYQSLYSGVASVLPGSVLANARFVISNHTWVAGTYSSPIEFNNTGLLVGQINPKIQGFNINVPAFITPQAEVGVAQILINNLSFYRAANGISADKTASLSSTVPHIPAIRADNTQFSFTTTAAFNTLPTSPTNTVSASLSGVSSSTSILLSTTDQNLTATSGMPVPTNNTQTVNYNYSISAATLKENFVQAGNYSAPLTYTWSKPTAADPSGTLQVQRAGTLEVVVSDLAELVTNQNTVDLTFTSTGDYQSGVVKDMPAHLRISKTTPYDLYVRASSADFSSGINSIPLDVLRIGPMTGETGMNTVTLSTTPQQLIDSADPVIDRQLNVRYSIPAEETSKLLNKPSGTYSTDIVFSFVAP